MSNARSTSTVWRWFLAALIALGGLGALLQTPREVAAIGESAGRVAKGKLVGWGYNGFVELAFTPQQKYPTPIENTDIGEIVGVSTGGYHTLALRDDGTLRSWGNNSYGSLGDGTTGSRFVSKPVALPGAVIAFSAGDAHSLAVTADGLVWSWGWNSSGQLGIGTVGDKPTPVAVKGPGGVGQLGGVVAVAASSRHSAALKADGTVWAWGWNSDGALGNTIVGPQSSLPVQVGSLTDVVSISLGFSHGLALKKDGTVWAWGSNLYGQLGDGTKTNRFTPVQVSSLGKVRAIAAGTQFSLALLTTGTVYSWGFNGQGQLGIGPGDNRTIPVPVNGIAHAALDEVIAISASDKLSSGGHSLALLNDGTVASWGDNTFGQGGNGTSGNPITTPTRVQLPGAPGDLLANVVAINAGSNNSKAIVGPTFGDLGGLPANTQNAVTQLAARGIIKGCDQAATPPLFCPGDPTLRAQMAALIARAVGWDAEDHANTFSDRCLAPGNCIDDALWRNVGTLQFYGVARGYADGTYDPFGEVLHAQTISFITRAMVKKGRWIQATVDNGTVYPNIPVGSGHRLDFVTYVANVGPVPGTTSASQTFAPWDQPSTRAWFALALWQAIK